MLFYLLIKDHPFQNGNKRIAVTTLIVFLLKNEKWLDVDKRLLYEFTVWVASSRPEERNFVLMPLTNLLKKMSYLRKQVSKNYKFNSGFPLPRNDNKCLSG